MTFTTGDSGTGKSAVFSFLQELSSEDGRIVCFNYIDRNKGCKDTILKARGKLFINDEIYKLDSENIDEVTQFRLSRAF